MKQAILLFSFLMSFSCTSFAAMISNSSEIITNIPTKEKIAYLTLDACNGKTDKRLIVFLTQNKIPTTLFLSGKWIKKNPEIAKKLSLNPLFKIENHGTNHKPASTTETTVYGIKGTKSKEELINEITDNSKEIEKLTHTKPSWFRSGTATYDKNGIKVISSQHIKIAGFAINADQGAKLKKEQVYKNTIKVKSGDIIIAHMNHPESETYEGLKKAITELKKKGWTFATLPSQNLAQTSNSKEKFKLPSFKKLITFSSYL